MPRKHYKPEEIIHKLREAEVLAAQGHKPKEIARQIGVSVQTYYRWRREYEGMDKSQAKRLKELERENARLKQLVADLSLDKSILQEALSKNA
jgi:putative transposase